MPNNRFLGRIRQSANIFRWYCYYYIYCCYNRWLRFYMFRCTIFLYRLVRALVCICVFLPTPVVVVVVADIVAACFGYGYSLFFVLFSLILFSLLLFYIFRVIHIWCLYLFARERRIRWVHV